MPSAIKKNILQLVSGVLVSQAIMLLATPLLTRIFDPAEFGVLAVFTACSAILAGVFTLKYDQAIPIPRRDPVAWALTVLTLLLSGSLSTLFLLLLMVYYAVSDDMPAVFLLLPITIFLSAVITCYQQWATRFRNYTTVAAAQIINSSINVFTAMLIGVLFTATETGLVWAFVVGLSFSAFYLRYKNLFRYRRMGISVGPLKRAAFFLYRFRKFPMHQLPTALVLLSSQYLQPIIIGSISSFTDTGFYAIASRVLMLPAIVIGGAVAEALKAELIRLRSNRLPVTPLLMKTSWRLIALAFVIYVVIILCSELVFGIVFGSVYVRAGQFAAMIGMGMLASFVYQCLVAIFLVFERTGLGLIVQSIITVVPLLLLILFSLDEGLDKGLLIWSYWTVALSALGIGVVFMVAYEVDKRLHKTMLC